MSAFKKISIAAISFLSLIILAETYICRDKLKETAQYYKNKIVFIRKENKKRKESIKSLENFLNSETKPHSVMIFEPNNWHHECFPGYAKYFTDLGYNVDVLTVSGSEDSLDFFEPKDKLKIFAFKNLKDVDYAGSEVSQKFSKYDCCILHSSDLARKELIEKLGFFKNEKSMFIAHDTDCTEELGIEYYKSKNRVIGLADYGEALYVNPHYFGDIPVKPKNEKTKFFITSTVNRDYKILIDAVRKLKSKDLDFEISVTGRSSNFSKESVPKDILKYFDFKGKVSYKKMYEEVQNSDYLIVLLDPARKDDNLFRTKRATGTAQLSYGFLKPLIIKDDFADVYRLNSENAIIYKENALASAMEKAIKTNSTEYSKTVDNLKELSEDIYNKSIDNLKSILE